MPSSKSGTTKENIFEFLQKKTNHAIDNELDMNRSRKKELMSLSPKF
jgi:hypothetical protein